MQILTIIFSDRSMTIHTPIERFFVLFGPKKPKNRVKILIIVLNDVLKNRVLGHKLVKIDRF
jgi:hypothetical protein